MGGSSHEIKRRSRPFWVVLHMDQNADHFEGFFTWVKMPTSVPAVPVPTVPVPMVPVPGGSVSRRFQFRTVPVPDGSLGHKRFRRFRFLRFRFPVHGSIHGLTENIDDKSTKKH